MLYQPNFDGMATVQDVVKMFEAAVSLRLLGWKHHFDGSQSIWYTAHHNSRIEDKFHHSFTTHYRKLTNPGSKRGKLNQNPFKFPAHGSKAIKY